MYVRTAESQLILTQAKTSARRKRGIFEMYDIFNYYDSAAVREYLVPMFVYMARDWTAGVSV